MREERRGGRGGGGGGGGGRERDEERVVIGIDSQTEICTVYLTYIGAEDKKQLD